MILVAVLILLDYATSCTGLYLLEVTYLVTRLINTPHNNPKSKQE
jgi:hypothetical protein